jgi:archaeal type IV pilus assembly protein PilA
MRHIIREDEDAVSPVIATILMVAITVVLAAVLYVMVSGLITGPGSTPQSMGVSVQTGDGTNWILVVSSTPSGKQYTTTTLAIFKGDGSNNLTARSLESLTVASSGCTLSKVSSTATTVQVGDRILCRTSWYLSGSTYQISDANTILATGKFQ